MLIHLLQKLENISERYLQEIGKVELLAPKEEVALAIIRQGDQKAFKDEPKANLPFVVSIKQTLIVPDN